VELDGAEHDAVIGERDAGHAVVRGATTKRIDSASAVEERVLAMNVEMNERRIGHGVSADPSVSAAALPVFAGR
jgi:hypothetical protein